MNLNHYFILLIKFHSRWTIDLYVKARILELQKKTRKNIVLSLNNIFSDETWKIIVIEEKKRQISLHKI